MVECSIELVLWAFCCCCWCYLAVSCRYSLVAVANSTQVHVLGRKDTRRKRARALDREPIINLESVWGKGKRARVQILCARRRRGEKSRLQQHGTDCESAANNWIQRYVIDIYLLGKAAELKTRWKIKNKQTNKQQLIETFSAHTAFNSIQFHALQSTSCMSLLALSFAKLSSRSRANLIITLISSPSCSLTLLNKKMKLQQSVCVCVCVWERERESKKRRRKQKTSSIYRECGYKMMWESAHARVRENLSQVLRVTNNN